MELKKINHNIQLNLPEFNCDSSPLGKDFEYPISLMNKYHFTLFCGRSGSGKTSMMVSLITTKGLFRKRFENIILVMPHSSRQSLKKNIFDKNLDEDNIYDELDEDVLDDIMEKIYENREENEKTLLILDDVATRLKKNKYLETMLMKLVYNKRHLKLCIWCAVQTFSSLPLNCRKNINFAFLYKPSKKEFINLFEELFEMKKEKSMELMKLYDKPYIYIFMDVYQQKFFKKLDYEIIISH